jgi:hypothetical protein
MRGSVGGDRNAWSGRWRRSWWWNTWRRKEAETYGRGCPAGVSQYVEAMVPGSCPLNRWTMVDAPSVSSSVLRCGVAWRVVPASPQIEVKRQPSVSEDCGAISSAVALLNVWPALWDELAREHAEARTRVVEEPALTWLVGDEGVAGSCSDVGRRCWRPLCPFPLQLTMQVWEQRCAVVPDRKLLAVSWL